MRGVLSTSFDGLRMAPQDDLSLRSSELSSKARLKFFAYLTRIKVLGTLEAGQRTVRNCPSSLIAALQGRRSRSNDGTGTSNCLFCIVRLLIPSLNSTCLTGADLKSSTRPRPPESLFRSSPPSPQLLPEPCNAPPPPVSWAFASSPARTL